MYLSFFAGHVAERGASDRSRRVRSVNQVDSGRPNHHQDTCLNRDLSKILWPRLNHKIGESLIDTWPHLETLIKIRWAKIHEIVGSWPT